MLQLSYSKQIFQHILCQLIFFSHTVLCSYVKLCGFVFFFFLNLKNEFFQDVAVVKMLSVISTNSINTSDLKSHKKKNAQTCSQCLRCFLYNYLKLQKNLMSCFLFVFVCCFLGGAGGCWQALSTCEQFSSKNMFLLFLPALANTAVFRKIQYNSGFTWPINTGLKLQQTPEG